jgi:pimeloyl-ACP methyl ester carboxylesterase
MSTWIFLRGLTRESRHWGNFPETFRRELPDARILMPDLPGNGVLNSHESPLRVEEMAEGLRARLPGQGLRPPYHVLAMSLGAMVAVAWAARHPHEIRRVVLINTSLRPFSPFYRRLKPGNYPRLLKLGLVGGSDRDWESTILQLTSRQAECPEEVLKNWVAYRGERPVSSRNALRQLLAAARYRAPLVRPEPPMLVLTSRQDALVDTACSRQLAEDWKTGFAEHSTAGHDLPLDDGAWVARQVGDWLQTLAR